MRFKLTHHYLAMLTKHAIVGETYSGSHTTAQLQQVWSTYKVYKTV